MLTLTLIDGVESLATIAAIDKIDPFRRKSDPNRTLFAMGVSNMCSSMVGGLTIIPGGVKSTACIVGGGRTQWANFYNAMFLILYIVIGRSVINLMPLSALGAIVIYTGYKLCAPKVWKHIAHIGSEQLFVFTATVLVTLTTDLLWGIAAGIVAKLLLEVVDPGAVERGRPKGTSPFGLAVRRWLVQAGELFRNPVVQRGDGRRDVPPLLRPAAGLLQRPAPRTTALARDPRRRLGRLPPRHRPGDADRPHHGGHAARLRRGLQAERPGHRPDRRPGPPARALARRVVPARRAAPVLAQELAEARVALARRQPAPTPAPRSRPGRLPGADQPDPLRADPRAGRQCDHGISRPSRKRFGWAVDATWSSSDP